MFWRISFQAFLMEMCVCVCEMLHKRNQAMLVYHLPFYSVVCYEYVEIIFQIYKTPLISFPLAWGCFKVRRWEEGKGSKRTNSGKGLSMCSDFLNHPGRQVLLPIAQMGKSRSQQQRAMESAFRKVSAYSTSFAPPTHLLPVSRWAPPTPVFCGCKEWQRSEDLDVRSRPHHNLGESWWEYKKICPTEVGICFPFSLLRKEGAAVSSWRHSEGDGSGNFLERRVKGHALGGGEWK